MVEYQCERCMQKFKQKGHYTTHINRKNPCQEIEANLDFIIEKKVNEALDKKNVNEQSSVIPQTEDKLTLKIEKKVDDVLKKQNVNEQSSVISQTDDNLSLIIEKNIKKIEIENCDGLDYLKKIKNNSIDLILTDPPYIISKDSGMNKHYEKVKSNEKEGIKFVKTEEDWVKYTKTKGWKKFMEKNKITDENHKLYKKYKNDYLKYGSKYGKKYATQTNYGKWDSEFTLEKLEEFIKIFYTKLRKGGTLILFFDIWKITDLKNIMEKYKFKQIRFIEWIKTNPQPLNSKINYLTNCREIALLGVKGGKPTFNSSYDNAIYRYPIQSGKNRIHKTQKSLRLFEDLIRKHSKVGDTVLDPFLGGGTTAIACKNTNRHFKGCEIDKSYYDKLMTLLKNITLDKNTKVKKKIKLKTPITSTKTLNEEKTNDINNKTIVITKVKKNRTNETIGMTAEYVCCDIFGLKHSIEEDRIDEKIGNKMKNIVKQFFEDNNLCLTKHLGKNNGKVDFKGKFIDNSSSDLKISMKTLKKKDGKICPQKGQPTYKSFHEHYEECDVPNENSSRIEANTLRFNWIKDNIGKYLNIQQKNTFCCDYLVLISNCENKPHIENIKNPKYDFEKEKISFSRPNYVEPQNSCKKDGVCEFSTDIFMEPNNRKVGELQFHFKGKLNGKPKGRDVIKFRFYKQFFK